MVIGRSCTAEREGLGRPGQAPSYELQPGRIKVEPIASTFHNFLRSLGQALSQLGSPPPILRILRPPDGL